MKLFLDRFKKQKSVYLDFASTTPVAPEVFSAMEPFFTKQFFNPSASYTRGQNNKKIIQEARKKIASITDVKSNEVIFTQGGTEAINLALIGLCKKIKNTESFTPHIIVSTIEHPAVYECVEYLKTQGVEVDYAPVLESGKIDIQALVALINERTICVSIIGASNETGVIQPIHKISSQIKKYKNSIKRTFTQYPYIHVDASQLALTEDVSLSRLGVDMMTIDSSKIYGPKMSGVLLKKQHVEIEPLLYGGGQEFGLRPGTESLPSIVGCARALELAQSVQATQNTQFKNLKEFFIKELNKTQIKYSINGSDAIVPHIINICILGLQSDFAVIQLDEYSVECSAMTSCASSKGTLRSKVLDAMSKADCASSSLRISFGRTTTTSDIKKAVQALAEVCRDQGVRYPENDKSVV